MKLKSGEDLLKYMTERAVWFIETPGVVRKQHRLQTKEHWKYRWFGLLPLAIDIWLKNRRDKQK